MNNANTNDYFRNHVFFVSCGTEKQPEQPRKKNIMITNDDETIVIYDTTLSTEQIKKWCERVDARYNDVFEVKQDELQFYCIDNRFYFNESEDKAILNIINRN